VTADVRGVFEAARAVFIRLDEDATRHLEQSWRGDAGRRALEALRRYIAEALDGFAGRSSFPGMALPQMPPMPTVASPAVPGATMPAGFGALNPPSPLSPSTPMASHRNGFDEYGAVPATNAAASPSPAPTLRAAPDASHPLPPASQNAATTSPAPPAGSAPATPAGQARGAMPYMPLMGTAYPGAVGRDDGGTRPTPGFLISIDNGNELIGPLPKVSPPVLGGG
jgi:hypothetical protein